MAGHSTQRQKQLSRLAIIIIVILFAAVLARQLFRSKATLRDEHPRARSPHTFIEGRWKDVRTSLGLPPLPDTINQSAAILPPSTLHRTGKLPSRFDLRRKRAEADLQSQNRLHLAADVRDAPRVSVQALAASFRRIAAAEKEIAEMRSKHEKSGQKARIQRRIEGWQDPINAKDVLTND
ncbi:uncharacterized protein EDB93DRAFT_803115 [Suillus bovinus]|uniref:uncharacterized protein n=1 Tax=Suillus bovinus TaxID=48563 RepID=UPI001B879C04|nr:uncharacterized protein EDB93DRAFT_803115 [Suillus bovinus]KAG2157625.1 hypothetical protein EDB93DRAFT_803115 [Suillus bovinus]